MERITRFLHCLYLQNDRSRAECDKIFEPLDMAENLGAKIKAILKKKIRQA